MNKNLHNAKRKKNDEFYTQLSDIEKELRHYRPHFMDKVVLCNCDDPRVSNFFHYFSYNFERLALKKLITTCYQNQERDLFSQHDNERAIYLEYEGDKNGNKIPDVEEIGVKELKGDGDFRSGECIELLKQADIVVTNPPFSLFREYVAQLVEYEKKFVILGGINAITYKEIFPLLKENKMWLGPSIYSGDREFQIPESVVNLDQVHDIRTDENGKKVYITRAIVRWYTNLTHKKRNEKLILVKNYKGHEQDYPKYDNYDAIEVSRVVNIPKDYTGVMGVPISFMDKYNPDQFEIVSMSTMSGVSANYWTLIDGKPKYARIYIKRKRV
jgi:hypothetical protein